MALVPELITVRILKSVLQAVHANVPATLNATASPAPLPCPFRVIVVLSDGWWCTIMHVHGCLACCRS